MIYQNRKESRQEEKAKKTVSKSFLPEEIDVSILETIPYKYSGSKTDVELSFSEFSCICPFSGLPDFARLTIKYVPWKKLVELKSLKYYFYAFRNVKIYNEHVVNKIKRDLKNVLCPRSLEIIAEFTVRGGIKNKVTANFKSKKNR